MLEHDTPVAQEYHMPAEWERHAATWLAWPHNLETWPQEELPEVEDIYLEIIRNLVPGETVHILVKDDLERIRVHGKIHDARLDSEAIKLHIIPTNDAWIRDYGPNFLLRPTAIGNQVALNKWKFDSWGGKYEWELDIRATDEIVEMLGLPHFEPGIVLEGGAIEVNGQGVCLTTESCLLNPNRNGGLSREKMESYLTSYLGVHKVIWLNAQLAGDDTDGHIDNLARFVSSDTIVCASEEDPQDANYESLKTLYETLSHATDIRNKPFRVIRMPMPGEVETRGVRLPASYANFYIGNQAILLPTYNHPYDEKAAEILKECFPNRKVAGIPCETLVWGLGGIHCITQQEPAHQPPIYRPLSPVKGWQ